MHPAEDAPTLAPTIAGTPFSEPAMSVPQILFSFRGRIPRKAFWLYGVFGLLLFSVLAELMLGIAGVNDARADRLVNLLIVWPALAIGVKRWHDRDRSGWWVLINLIPVVGTLWALVANGFLRGTPGPNRFGADLSAEF